jgi:hypothetical protein
MDAAEYLHAKASACPHPSDAPQMGPKNGAMFIGDYGKWMPTADPGAVGKAVGLWREKRASRTSTTVTCWSQNGPKTLPRFQINEAKNLSR